MVIGCALSLVVSCGSDGSPRAQPGAGGEIEGGGTDGSDGGGTSSTGAKPGGGSSSGPGTGELGSIWKQSTAELLVFGTDTGIPTQANVELPDLYPVPETDAEVEMYTSIQDGQLLTYAFVHGADSYYLVKSTLLGSDDTYQFQLGSMSGIYTLEDGVLKRMSTSSTETTVTTMTTIYEPYSGDFPPESWPTKEVVLDMTSGGAP
jgi:hypothetical protein